MVLMIFLVLQCMIVVVMIISFGLGYDKDDVQNKYDNNKTGLQQKTDAAFWHMREWPVRGKNRWL